MVMFTIGVGTDLDAAALMAIASRPDYFFRAPDAEALDAIYRDIAMTVPCPGGELLGRAVGCRA